MIDGARPLRARAPGRGVIRIDELVTAQPGVGVRSVLLEPGAGGTESKCVTPFIHVAQHAITTEAPDLVREQDLQTADAVLLLVIAARVRVEARAPLGRHAHEVRRLVQDGMEWGVEAREQTIVPQARFAFAPVGAGNGRVLCDQLECEPEACEQRRDVNARNAAKPRDGHRSTSSPGAA